MSYHINKFAEKVTAMNQTGAKNLTLTADEVRNLHSAVFALMERIVDLTESSEEPTTTVVMDGGNFK